MKGVEARTCRTRHVRAVKTVYAAMAGRGRCLFGRVTLAHVVSRAHDHGGYLDLIEFGIRLNVVERSATISPVLEGGQLVLTDGPDQPAEPVEKLEGEILLILHCIMIAGSR